MIGKERLMEHKLIDNIDFCRWKYGWTVTIKDFYGLMLKTLGVSEVMRSCINHESRYCLLIKSDPRAFSHCISTSNNNLRNYLQNSPKQTKGFVGTCYCGVREFVMPVYYEETVIGAVIVGASKCDAARQESTFDRLTLEFGFRREDLKNAYEAFPPTLQDLQLIRQQATVWALCLELLCEKFIDPQQLKAAQRMLDSGQDPHGNKLNQAILYIKNHLSETITVEQVAGACYCSESSIAHLFKQQLNVGVNAFIIGERLAIAKRMLVHTNLTVAEIALQCGFGSNKYMTGTFKRKLGVTPTEYRAQNRDPGHSAPGADNRE